MGLCGTYEDGPFRGPRNSLVCNIIYYTIIDHIRVWSIRPMLWTCDVDRRVGGTMTRIPEACSNIQSSWL